MLFSRFERPKNAPRAAQKLSALAPNALFAIKHAAPCSHRLIRSGPEVHVCGAPRTPHRFVHWRLWAPLTPPRSQKLGLVMPDSPRKRYLQLREREGELVHSPERDYNPALEASYVTSPSARGGVLGGQRPPSPFSLMEAEKVSPSNIHRAPALPIDAFVLFCLFCRSLSNSSSHSLTPGHCGR